MNLCDANYRMKNKKIELNTKIDACSMAIVLEMIRKGASSLIWQFVCNNYYLPLRRIPLCKRMKKKIQSKFVKLYTNTKCRLSYYFEYVLQHHFDITRYFDSSNHMHANERMCFFSVARNLCRAASVFWL